MLHAYRTIDTVVESNDSLGALSYLSTDDPRRHWLTLEVLSTTDEGLDLEVEMESEPTSPHLAKTSIKPSIGSEKDFTKATVLSSMLWIIGFGLSVSFYPTSSGMAGAKRGLGLSSLILGLIFSLHVLRNIMRAPSFSFPLGVSAILPILILSFGVYLFYQGTKEWRKMLISNPWDTTSRLHV